MTTAPKKGCFGRNLFITCGVLVVIWIVLGVVAYIVVAPSIGKVVDSIAAPLVTSQDFMTAVKSKAYAKAYSMVITDQQASFGGSAQGMQDLFTQNGWEPTSFTLSNVQSGGDAIVNGTGVFGTATKYVYISLRKDGDTWKILGLQINDNAPTATPAS